MFCKKITLAAFFQRYIFFVGAVSLLFTISFAIPALAFSGSGAGNLGSPYIITTCSQLAEMQSSLSSYYQLGNDINCGSYGNFTPIGTGSSFSGTLDGASHTISNLTVSTTAEAGLFAFTQSSTIKNVTLYNSSVYSSGVDFGVGAIIGTDYGVTTTISRVAVVSTTVSGSNAYYIGGIMGQEEGASILQDSYSAATLTGQGGGTLGGLIGTVQNGSIPVTIQRSYFSGVANSSGYVSGLIGALGSGPSASISDSFSAGILSTSGGGGYSIGALIGATNSNSLTATDTYYDAKGNGSLSCTAYAGPLAGCSAVNTNGLDSNHFAATSSTNPFLAWDFSSIWNVTNAFPTFSVAPSQTTGLGAAAPSTTTVALFWTAPANSASSSIVGYKIERESPVGAGFSTLVANTDSTSTSYTDSSLTPSTTYNYRVSAINNIGSIGSASNQASAITYSWQNLGSAGFSTGFVGYTSLAFNPSGTPYIAFEDFGNGDKATVMKFNGSSWVNVGSAGFSAGFVNYTSLAFDASGTPYLAFVDYGNGDKATVMKFNGSSWVNVGSAGFSAGFADFVSLAISSTGTPYIAFEDFGNHDKATVMKFDGSSWVNVGSAGFSAGTVNFTSLTLDATGTPYLAYEDFGNGDKATVMKFDGSSWVNVGGAGFSAGFVNFASLAIDTSGTPYLAYEDFGNGDKATVMKFNGSSWVNVGSAGFSTSYVNFTSLAFDPSGTPYIAYEDFGNSDKATVMKFNGSSWANVGSAGFSAGFVEDVSLALSTSGTPYIAYQDGGTGDRATVMTFGGVPPTLDTTTLTPILTAPVSGTYLDTSTTTISYTLPEDGSAGTATATFLPTAGGTTTTITFSNVSAGSHTISFIPSGNLLVTGVQSVSTSTLADGTYTVVFSYQDALGNSAATASASNVVIAPPTSAPILTSPASGDSDVDTSAMTIDYTLPQTMLSGSLHLFFIPTVGSTNTIALKDVSSGNHTFTLTPSGGIQSLTVANSATADTLADGTYTVRLSYQNSYGSPTSSISATGVVITAPPVTPAPQQNTSTGGGGVIIPVQATAFGATANGNIAPLSFTVNNNNPLVTSTKLSLTFNANSTTVKGYVVSLDPNFTGASIVPFTGTTQAVYTLPTTTPGTYKLYLKYYSITGNYSALLSQTFTYAPGSKLTVVAKTNSNSTTIISTLPAGFTFTRTLKLGSRGADVKALQVFLNTHGFPVDTSGIGSPGHESTLYGKLTAVAVTKFQEANATIILAPLRLTKGTGIFGISTIKVVKGMYTK